MLDRGGGVHLIDVPVDCNENIRMLVDEITHRVKEIELA
jgi:hypothetical protein